jgi:hypothetical protein
MWSASKIQSFLPLIFIGLAALISLRAFVTDSVPLKSLSRLWMVVFVVESIGHFTPEGESNHWLYNVYHYFFYLSLANIFYHQLNNEKNRIAIRVFYIVFTVFVFCNSLFFQGLSSLQTLTVVVGGSFIMFLAGAYFWQLFISTDNEQITRDPFFWLSFGLIVYFGGTIPFLGMLNYLTRNFYEFTVLYHKYISNAFSIFLNITIIVGFLCRKVYPKLS